MPPDFDTHWPERIAAAVPGCEVRVFGGEHDIEDADAVFGSVARELFPRAKKLRWIAAARAPDSAGPGSTMSSWPATLSLRACTAPTTWTSRPTSWPLCWPSRDASTVPAAPGRAGVAFGMADARPAANDGADRWDRRRRSGGRTAVRAFGMRVIGVDPRVRRAPPGFAALYPPGAASWMRTSARLTSSSSRRRRRRRRWACSTPVASAG